MIKILCDNPAELYERLAEQAFEALSLTGEAFVELVFVDEDTIRQINAQERNVDRVTDVLSFPSLDEIAPFTEQNYPYEFDPQEQAVSLGSIVVCDEVAKSQAAEYGHSETRERAYLFLHGLLHLLGYDHIEEEDKKQMRMQEERVLAALGITREDD